MCSSTFFQAVDVVRFLTPLIKKNEKILTQQIVSSLPASEFNVLGNPTIGVTGLVAAVTIVFFPSNFRSNLKTLLHNLFYVFFSMMTGINSFATESL